MEAIVCLIGGAFDNHIQTLKVIYIRIYFYEITNLRTFHMVQSKLERLS